MEFLSQALLELFGAAAPRRVANIIVALAAAVLAVVLAVLVFA